MAPLNPFPARPAARPTNQAQQDRGQQGGWPSPDAGQQQPAWPQPQAQGRVNQGYPNAGYPQDYAAHPQPQSGPQLGDPYAPQFEPYSPAQRYNPQSGYGTAPASGYPAAPASGYQPGYGQPQPQAQPQAQAQQYGVAQQQPHYGAQTQWADPHGFDVGAFGAAAYANEAASHAYDTQGQQDWHHQEAGAGYAQQDGYQQQQSGEFGFAQPSGGELDPGYGEDEEYEYEDAEPRRGPRFMMMAAALAGAIVVGGGMAYGYRALFGSGADGEPPVVKSASAPSKIKPADAGGMQFDHAERKIMSRLGEGSAAAGGASSSAQAASDESGTRKVSTLVVGRDGSIQAPPTNPATGVPGTSVSVPGMTVVDAFGSAGRAAEAPPPAAPAAAPTPPAPVADKKVVVSPPAAEASADKPITVTKVNAAPAAAPAATASLADAEPEVETPKPAKKVKVAAANPDDAFSPAAAAAKPAASSSGINGYVAVLASIPRSDSSRMDALKRFADLQQKYGSILAGKTPDVAEANLGAKGNYHRLVVGPPGSREKASTLCSQLKAEGFGDCWVTGY